MMRFQRAFDNRGQNASLAVLIVLVVFASQAVSATPSSDPMGSSRPLGVSCGHTPLPTNEEWRQFRHDANHTGVNPAVGRLSPSTVESLTTAGPCHLG